MNRAILAELQRQRCYPSISVLVNTTPAVGLSPSEFDTLMRLVGQVDDRLEGDVSDSLRAHLIERLRALLEEQSGKPSAHALALFVSTECSAAVRLGRQVDERTTIDDTFTTPSRHLHDT